MAITLPDWYQGLRVAIQTVSPLQADYWASATMDIPAGQTVYFVIESGFTEEWEWIPEGYRFSITGASVTISTNTLISFGVGYETKYNPGTYIIRGEKFGYQSVEFTLGNLGTFYENTRPIYKIVNYADHDVITYFNVWGILEKIKE